LKLWKHRDDFLFFVGWAAMSVFGVKNGANGIVPSMGNLIPDLYQKLFDWAENGNIKEAEKVQEQINLISGYCQRNRNLSESIPALKVLMAMKNLCGTEVLPPMVKLTDEEEVNYRNEMKVWVQKL
jgi:4-hydroxy-tetrahydrodipicolinate synthase